MYMPSEWRYCANSGQLLFAPESEKPFWVTTLEGEIDHVSRPTKNKGLIGRK